MQKRFSTKIIFIIVEASSADLLSVYNTRIRAFDHFIIFYPSPLTLPPRALFHPPLHISTSLLPLLFELTYHSLLQPRFPFPRS